MTTLSEETLHQWYKDADAATTKFPLSLWGNRVIALLAELCNEREKSKRFAERASRYEKALKFIKNKTESDDLLSEELRARSTSIYIKAREALASGGGE